MSGPTTLAEHVATALCLLALLAFALFLLFTWWLA